MKTEKGRRFGDLDITIYRRLPNGMYLNLTDYEIIGENEVIEVEASESEYIIIFTAYLSRKYIANREAAICCEVTLEEIEQYYPAMARGTGKGCCSFRSRFEKAEMTEEYAMILAKMILKRSNSDYFVMLVDDTLYFQARKSKSAIPLVTLFSKPAKYLRIKKGGVV